VQVLDRAFADHHFQPVGLISEHFIGIYSGELTSHGLAVGKDHGHLLALQNSQVFVAYICSPFGATALLARFLSRPSVNDQLAGYRISSLSQYQVSRRGLASSVS